VDVPAGVCLQCFNEQQRFAYPFLVYCVHGELLALVQSAHESTTFHCKPQQLRAVLAKLVGQGVTNALPPTRDGL
jgi:hypothetical protein